MAEVQVEGLSKRFGGRGAQTQAVDDVSFGVRRGEMLVLLGPSGCGKTTTLRCLAGLEDPDEGRIELHGTVVADRRTGVKVPTHRRDIGLVFQTFALWPHLSARRNIEFPLRTAGAPPATRGPAIRQVAKLVDLDEALLDKRPGLLSGGQQQRVGLARALVAEPPVVLFDEPLGSLDALLREQLRSDLRVLHRQVGFTGIYVTHDFSEALALGDQIAVMRHGRIEQMGAPEQVFSRPATREVARLIGFRELTTVEPRAGGRTTGPVRLPELRFVDEPPEAIEVFVRPEHVELRPPGDGPATTRTCLRVDGAEVGEVTYLDGRFEVVVEVGARRIKAVTGSTGRRWRVGDRVAVDVALEHARFFDEQGQQVMPIGTERSEVGNA